MEYIELKRPKYLGTDYKKLNIPLKYKRAIATVLDVITNSDISNNIYKILLFGSCAKQTTTIGSDVDVLVVTENKLDKEVTSRLRYKLYNRISDNIVDVDIIFYTKEEYFNGKSPLTESIKLCNIILYSKDKEETNI